MFRRFDFPNRHDTEPVAQQPIRWILVAIVVEVSKQPHPERSIDAKVFWNFCRLFLQSCNAYFFLEKSKNKSFFEHIPIENEHLQQTTKRAQNLTHGASSHQFVTGTRVACVHYLYLVSISDESQKNKFPFLIVHFILQEYIR
jgi:hypothetical protein